ERLLRLGARERTDPLATVDLGDLAAVGEQPEEAVTPVLTREPETRAVVRRQLLRGLVELGERRGDLDTLLLEDLRDVEDVARAPVVRDGVELAVVRAGLDERLGADLVPTEVGEERGEVAERADRGEGRSLRVADLDEVRG